VEQKFKKAWQTGHCPTIKKIYKVIENKSFLMPYDRYKYDTPFTIDYHTIIYMFPVGSAWATKCSDIMEHARLAL
jgi:hypothetical protein